MDTTHIEIIVTDMGNGASYCGSCGHNLDQGQPKPYPSVCPVCNKKFVETSLFVNRGGSDF